MVSPVVSILVETQLCHGVPLNADVEHGYLSGRLHRLKALCRTLRQSRSRHMPHLKASDKR
jgi:hypothetical protein